ETAAQAAAPSPAANSTTTMYSPAPPPSASMLPWILAVVAALVACLGTIVLVLALRPHAQAQVGDLAPVSRPPVILGAPASPAGNTPAASTPPAAPPAGQNAPAAPPPGPAAPAAPAVPAVASTWQPSRVPWKSGADPG